MGNSKEECREAVVGTVRMFQELRFTINWDKSELIPMNQLVFLGFKLDSKQMNVALMDDKKPKISRRGLKMIKPRLTKNKKSSWPDMTNGFLRPGSRVCGSAL